MRACTARSARSSAPSSVSASSRRRNRAGQDHRRVDHRQAAEDVLAQAAGADRGRNRRGADADDCRDADAGHDRRQRQRQLDLPQQLPRRHAQRGPRLDERAVDRSHPRHRRADDRQQRVDDQHGDRDPRAEAADERQRQQEPEHRQARDRLRHVGEPDERRAEAGPARREDAERNADRDGRGRRHGHQTRCWSSRPRNSARCAIQNCRTLIVRPAPPIALQAPPAQRVRASTSGCSIARTCGSGLARDRLGTSSATSTPSARTPMREPSANASPMSWVTITIVLRTC